MGIFKRLFGLFSDKEETSYNKSERDEQSHVSMPETSAPEPLSVEEQPEIKQDNDEKVCEEPFASTAMEQDVETEELRENDSDDEDISTYRIKAVKLEGFDELEEDERECIVDELEKEDSAYFRYNFEKERLEVYKQVHLLGWLPRLNMKPMLKHFVNDEVGAVEVKSINKKSVSVIIYIKDRFGEEFLPYCPETRPVSIVNTEYWNNPPKWEEDWELDLRTDELYYKFRNLYESDKQYKKLSFDVMIDFLLFRMGYLKGEFQTKQQIEDFIDFHKSTIVHLKDETAEKVFRKCVESYLEKKGWGLVDEIKPQMTINTPRKKKQYTPYFDINYVTDEGIHSYRVVKDSNLNLTVVGMNYRENYEQFINQINEGTVLTIKHDYDNPVDRTAIGFYLGETLVGYVRKNDKPAVELFLANGSLESVVEFAADNNVPTVVNLKKSYVDEDAIDKFDITITKHEKVKSDDDYQNTVETVDIDELCEYLED